MNQKHIEIERKFLLRGDFRPMAVRSERIVQAYLTVSPACTVRVRIKGERAFLTVKGPSNAGGISRQEFEYPIPVADAEAMLALAQTGRIDKERYYVPFEGHTFEVDVFHGRHEGLVIAELELIAEDEPYTRPDWLGEEVTGQAQYYNARLASDSCDSKKIP
jgi:CYTH domain-containing protein